MWVFFFLLVFSFIANNISLENSLYWFDLIFCTITCKFWIVFFFNWNYLKFFLCLNPFLRVSRHEQVCLMRLCFERCTSPIIRHNDGRSISRPEQVCLMRLCFKRYFSHHWAWYDKLIVLGTLNRQAKIFLSPFWEVHFEYQYFWNHLSFEAEIFRTF